MRLPAKNNKTPNSRFLDLRSLRYKSHQKVLKKLLKGIKVIHRKFI